MGDKKLTAFAREIKCLLARLSLPDVSRHVFIRSLPPMITTAIALNPASTLQELGKAADRAWAPTITVASTFDGGQTVVAIGRMAQQAGRGRDGHTRGDKNNRQGQHSRNKQSCATTTLDGVTMHGSAYCEVQNGRRQDKQHDKFSASNQSFKKYQPQKTRQSVTECGHDAEYSNTPVIDK